LHAINFLNRINASISIINHALTCC